MGNENGDEASAVGWPTLSFGRSALRVPRQAHSLPLSTEFDSIQPVPTQNF